MGYRGMINSEVQEIAKKHLGRYLKGNIELRLLPYLDYVMKNEMKIDPRKINQEERDLLKELKQEGHIAGGACGLQMTKEFYDAIQQILWQAYVVQGAIECNSKDDAIIASILNENQEVSVNSSQK